MLSGWNPLHRWALAIAAADVPSALTNMPIEIHINDESGKTDFDATGVFDVLTKNYQRFKIAVTESDDTELYVQIKYWSVANKTAILTVSRSDFVLPDAGCVLYFYADNAHVNNPLVSELGDNTSDVPSNVWGLFRGVWPMAENHWGFARNGFAGYYYACGPSIVYDSTLNKAYIAWQGDKAASAETYLTYPWVTEYDLDTDLFAANTMVRDYAIGSYDTHGGPAIMLDSSGYLHTLYGAHDSTSKGRYSVTDDPNDSTSWTYMGEFPWVAGASVRMTYPQFFRRSDGVVFCTYRDATYTQSIMYTAYRGVVTDTDAAHIIDSTASFGVDVVGMAAYVWTSGDATGAQQTIATRDSATQLNYTAGATAGDQYVIWSVPTVYLSDNAWGYPLIYSFGTAYDPTNERLWFSWGLFFEDYVWTATTTGVHDGEASHPGWDSSILHDADKAWTVDLYDEKYRITNTTTGAYGYVASNTAHTATSYGMQGGMRGGVSDNTWLDGDTFKLGTYPGGDGVSRTFTNRTDMFVAFMDVDPDSATYMHCFGLGDDARKIGGIVNIADLTATGHDCGTTISLEEADAYCNVFTQVEAQNEMCPRLHLDSLGYPHIMYAQQTGTNAQWYAGTNASAYYQRWDGDSWTTPALIVATAGKWTVIDFYIVPGTGGATAEIKVPITDATAYLKMYYSDDGGATWAATTELDWTRSYYHGGLNTFAYTPDLQYLPLAQLTMSMSLYVDAFAPGPNEAAVETMCICDADFKPVLTGSGNMGYIDDAGVNNYKARKKAARSPTGTVAQPADLLTTGIKGGKYGIANGNTEDRLIDTTLDQFTADDLGKTVYNLTDATSGTILEVVSATELRLDDDWFPDGNEYYRIGGNELPLACSQFEPGGNATAAGDWAQVYCGGSGATKLEPTAGIILRGWVLYHDHPSSQDSDYLSLMSKRDGTTGVWLEYQKANDWWNFLPYTTGGTLYNALKTIPSWEANQWHHIMGYYDSVAEGDWNYRGGQLWLDGVLFYSNPSLVNKFLVHAAGTDLLIGAYGQGTGLTMTKSYSHDGAMDELMIAVPATVSLAICQTMLLSESDNFLTWTEAKSIYGPLFFAGM